MMVRGRWLVPCLVSALVSPASTSRIAHATGPDERQVVSLIQRFYVDSVDVNLLPRGDLAKMLKSLDPHCALLPPPPAEPQTPRGDYAGVGILFDLRDNAIVVITPLEGTPAFRLGLRSGDRIVEVDHRALPKDLSNDDVFKLLRGPVGSVVNLTIEREGESQPFHLDIERVRVAIESIPYAYMIKPGVGYVRMTRFSQTTGSEFEKALDTLRRQGMTSLLIDLRANSGGLLSQAVDVLDQLVPSDKLLVYTRGRSPSANADYRSTGRPKVAVHEPIVVLIDHGSASAAEIVAGALQDLDRGLIAGTNSFGNGLVQNQFRLDDGSKLLLTVARFHTPSGRLIQRDDSKYEDSKDYREEPFKADVPSDSILAMRPKFRTTAGRTVYGGGGIYPDVVLREPPPPTPPQVDMIQKRVFFEFTARYMAQHGETKWTPETLGPSFRLSDAEWTELRRDMEKDRIAVSDSLMRADQDFMLRQVRAELASATIGNVERYKIVTESDTQLNAALALFQRAADLLRTGK